jgi:2-iminobutanoate/2-iminopropanoate deaminase
MASLKEIFEVYPSDPRVTLPLGLRVNDAIYGAGLSGADPMTGRAEGDAESQMTRALASLRDLVERGSLGPEDVLHVRAVVSDEAAAPSLEGPWRAMFESSERAVLEVVVSPLPPGYAVRLDVVASRDGAASPAEAGIRELSLAGDAGPAHVMRIGPLVFLPAVTTSDVAGQDTRTQIDGAFENMERLLEGAGTDHSQVLRIAGFLRDLSEKDLLNQKMIDVFPDPSQKPVHKYVPSVLPPGVEFCLQVIAYDGEERRILEMEGVRHNDPISLGARAGNLLVSSRVQARLEATPEEQTARLLDQHARRLLEQEGGGLENLTQAVVGIGDAAYRSAVEREWRKLWPEGSSRPRLDVIQADFPHSPLPRLEFIALVE